MGENSMNLTPHTLTALCLL